MGAINGILMGVYAVVRLSLFKLAQDDEKHELL